MSDPRPDSAADSPRRGPLVGRRTLAFVVALAALELVLKHAFGYGWWTVTEQSERYGWRMLPHQAGRSRDLSVAEDINGWGFRDREWPAPVQDADGTWVKDPDVYRVAMVGNSMTYGTSVPIEDSYGRQLERLLQERLDAAGDPRRVVVMNFAVQGYVFEQMARVHEDLIRRWRPDLMVVPFHPHDVMPMRPAVDDADYDLRTWVLRTATYDWLNRHVINHWLPRVPPPPKERGAIDWDGLDLFITQQPFDKANRPWWDQARQRMEQLRQTVETDGGRLLICSLPRWRKIFRPRIHDAARAGLIDLAEEYFGAPPEEIAIQELREADNPALAPLLAELLLQRGGQAWEREQDDYAARRDLSEARRLLDDLDEQRVDPVHRRELGEALAALDALLPGDGRPGDGRPEDEP